VNDIHLFFNSPLFYLLKDMENETYGMKEDEETSDQEEKTLSYRSQTQSPHANEHKTHLNADADADRTLPSMSTVSLESDKSSVSLDVASINPVRQELCLVPVLKNEIFDTLDDRDG
jgi:hypothetical protein